MRYGVVVLQIELGFFLYEGNYVDLVLGKPDQLMNIDGNLTEQNNDDEETK